MSRKGNRGKGAQRTGRASGKTAQYADLHELPEDERIAIIGDRIEAGKTVAVFVDSEPEKVSRLFACALIWTDIRRGNSSA